MCDERGGGGESDDSIRREGMRVVERNGEREGSVWGEGGGRVGRGCGI